MVKLLSSTGELTKVLATAARVCYSGLPLEELLSRYSQEEDETLVERVVGMGHLSVVEHGVFTFKVPPSLKEELFEIMVDKPFLKITQSDEGFIVSLNLRTMVELLLEKPDLTFTKEVSRYIPPYVMRGIQQNSP
jgi:hypothetical protein